MCPRCGFALIPYMGHDTCSMGCGYDGPTRAPTAEERGTHRAREPQFTKRARHDERITEGPATPVGQGHPRLGSPSVPRRPPCSWALRCRGPCATKVLRLPAASGATAGTQTKQASGGGAGKPSLRAIVAGREGSREGELVTDTNVRAALFPGPVSSPLPPRCDDNGDESGRRKGGSCGKQKPSLAPYRDGEVRGSGVRRSLGVAPPTTSPTGHSEEMTR